MTTRGVVVTCRSTGRTGALAGYAAQRLADGAASTQVVDLSRLDLNALARASSGSTGSSADLGVHGALATLDRARVVVLVTPVHQGSYAGVLKLFLDAVRRDGLAGKTVLVLGSAGTERHTLALATILPVLSAMGADCMPQPCCLSPNDWFAQPTGPQLRPTAADRLDRRLDLATRDVWREQVPPLSELSEDAVL